MPHLDRLYTKFRDAGFVVWGVNLDDSRSHAQDVLARLGIAFPVLFDPARRVIQRYELATMPSTVIVDRDGAVRYLHEGYQDGYEQVYEREITELLKR
jgi:peroxiredoxin